MSTQEPERISSQADTLGMSESQMRALGYQMVDKVVDHLMNRQEQPAIHTGSPTELRSALGGPVPLEAGNPEEVIRLLTESAFTHMQHGDHPRYFARVPGPSSFAAILGEWFATGFNVNVASWLGSSGPATLELVVCDWLRQLMGMPDRTEGVIVSGGSMASLTAMAAARTERGPGIVYISDQTHACIRRGLLAMGFPPGDIRVIPTDDEFRMSIQELSIAVLDDCGAGRLPLMVVATAGTTNTGAVDPIPEIADLCLASGMWLHVDGAYGAPAYICPEGEQLLNGINLADSLVLDPHKWLFQPYGAGCTLVRHPGLLADSFAINPEYLRDVGGDSDQVNFFDRSLELTRQGRAVRLWTTLRTYGVHRIQESIQRCLSLARYAQQKITESPETWRLITPAQLGILTFRLQPDIESASGKDVHTQLAARLSESGFAAVSSTTLKGQDVLRLCIINPLTTKDDINETLERLAAFVPLLSSF